MLAWLSVLAAFAPAHAAARPPALPASLISAALPSPAGYLWCPSEALPQAGHQAVCERKPVIARAALPDPKAYFMSAESFRAGDMTVHVAGSKDRRQKYGYYLAFTAEGDQPVWVKMGLGKKSFTLRGRPFTVETKLSILHHERIQLTVRDASGAVLDNFTVGELAQRVQDRGPRLSLLGREYHATFVEDIREDGGQCRILSEQHTVLLTTYETYTYDGGRTGYKFTQIPMIAEQLRGPAIQPRPMGAKAAGPKGEVPVVYGFHVTSRGELQVYDLTDYSREGLPACPPED